MKAFHLILVIGGLAALSSTTLGCNGEKGWKQSKAEPSTAEVYGPPQPQVLVVQENRAETKPALTTQVNPLQNSDAEFVSR